MLDLALVVQPKAETTEREGVTADEEVDPEPRIPKHRQLTVLTSVKKYWGYLTENLGPPDLSFSLGRPFLGSVPLGNVL